MAEKNKLALATRDGKNLLFTQEQFFQADNAIVILHEPLREAALANGYAVNHTVMEVAVWHNAKNFEFIARATGKTPSGLEMSEVGEANPTNLPTPIAMQYPGLMANKRAEDRLLITLMGLGAKDGSRIYSDTEIFASRETKARAPQAAAEDAAPLQEPKDALASLSLEELRSVKVDFGSYKASPITLGELKDQHEKDFKWLLNFPASSPKMSPMKAAAVALAEREAMHA